MSAEDPIFTRGGSNSIAMTLRIEDWSDNPFDVFNEGSAEQYVNVRTMYLCFRCVVVDIMKSSEWYFIIILWALNGADYRRKVCKSATCLTSWSLLIIKILSNDLLC